MSLKPEKDNQMLVRYYVLALLKAVHSKWPVEEGLKREIIDYSLEYVFRAMETQAKECIFQIQVGMMMVVYNSQFRALDYLFEKIIQEVATSTNSLKLLRLLQVLHVMQKTTGFRGRALTARICECLKPHYASTDPRIITQLTVIVLGSLRDIYSIPIPLQHQSDLFYQANEQHQVEKVPLYRDFFLYLATLLPQIKLVYESINYIINHVKGELITPLTLYYFQPFLLHIIHFREDEIKDENISNTFAAHHLHISQFEYHPHVFPILYQQAKNALSSDHFKTRQRAVLFIKVTHSLTHSFTPSTSSTARPTSTSSKSSKRCPPTSPTTLCGMK